MFSHVDFSAVVDEDDPLYYLHDGREPGDIPLPPPYQTYTGF